MKIKNISNKIIGIGDYILLPDETQEIPSKLGNSTAVSIYKDAKFIEVIAEDEAQELAKAEQEKAEAEEVKESAAEEAETNAEKLERLKDATDEEVAAMAKELGINMATCKTQADVRKKVTKALSK